MIHWRWLLLAVVLHGALGVRVARAADDEAKATQARALVERGQTMYRLGKFAAALGEFQAALALISRPSILLNIAQCQRQLKQHERALFYYRLYLTEWQRLDATAEAPFHGEVRRQIATINEELVRAGRERRRREQLAREERLRLQELVLTMSAPGSPPPPPPPPVYKRWWLWTIVGVAVAGVATATVLGVRAASGKDPVGGTLPPHQVQVD